MNAQSKDSFLPFQQGCTCKSEQEHKREGKVATPSGAPHHSSIPQHAIISQLQLLPGMEMLYLRAVDVLTVSEEADLQGLPH